MEKAWLAPWLPGSAARSLAGPPVWLSSCTRCSAASCLARRPVWPTDLPGVQPPGRLAARPTNWLAGRTGGHDRRRGVPPPASTATPELLRGKRANAAAPPLLSCSLDGMRFQRVTWSIPARVRDLSSSYQRGSPSKGGHEQACASVIERPHDLHV